MYGCEMHRTRDLGWGHTWVEVRGQCGFLLLQIRVNAVNPTVVMTPMGKKAWSDPAKAGVMLSRIPLGRFVGECGTSEQWN